MDCQHRWLIKAAELGVLPAKCKRCGAQRIFPLETSVVQGSLGSRGQKIGKVKVGKPTNI